MVSALLGAFILIFQFSFLYFGGLFNKTIIPLALVEYEMIMPHSALRTSLAIYHLISNVRSWNNCFSVNAEFSSNITGEAY